MNKMRDLIRSHPYLLIFSIVVVVVFWLPVFVVQDLSKRSWTIYLEDENFCNGDIVIDGQERIWVSGCCVTTGPIYSFDGIKWNTVPGNYCDLARGPDGRIWAVATHGLSLAVFDGEQETTWTNQDLGFDPEDEIDRIQIDPGGGLWMTLHLKNIDPSTSPAEFQLVRVVLEEGKQPVVTRYPELLPYEGVFSSLDADSQGRVWAGIKKSFSSEVSSGFYVFDGKKWLEVQLPQSEMHEIVQTAMDKQGNNWLATACGDIYKQMDGGWERVIEGFEHPRDIPPCFHSEINTNGITFDNHGRLWAWGHNSLRYWDGDKWITFNEDNSGVGGSVDNMIFDGQGRIWVVSSAFYNQGVSTTTLENPQPLPKILVDFHNFVEEHYWGAIWFIPTMLVLTWLAAYLGVLPGVLLAFVAGLAASVIWYMFIGIFVSIGGTIGGFIGGRKDRRSMAPVDRWTNMNVILSIIGSVIGFGIGFLFAFLFIGN